MPTRNHPRKKRRGWIASVKTTAIDVPENTMTQPPQKVAEILLAHNRGKTPGSINRFIQFYINRSGKGLAATRKRNLKKAMEIIRSHA
jgi:Protein of unknown function (DUF3175)